MSHKDTGGSKEIGARVARQSKMPGWTGAPLTIKHRKGLLRSEGGTDMSTSYAAGLAFGIVTALIIFALVWKFNKKSMKGKFDERQELVRGRGYKYACFTMLGLLTIDLLLESFGSFETLPVTRSLALFIIILAGVMVYALYCIKNDSYFGVGTDMRTYRAVMWVVIVCNAVSAFTGLREDGPMTPDGKLAFGPFVSLIFCIAFAIIMITIRVKQSNMAKEEAAEDEI